MRREHSALLTEDSHINACGSPAAARAHDTTAREGPAHAGPGAVGCNRWLDGTVITAIADRIALARRGPDHCLPTDTATPCPARWARRPLAHLGDGRN